MALRDQPYIPLYIQDFLTDEKLIECSASATGIYIRIMCIMHKSDEYGVISLKQKDKQTDQQIKNFASKLAKNMPYPVHEIEAAILELTSEGVLKIDENKLCQKRMIKDNAVSISRAATGKLGGLKRAHQANLKAKHQANTLPNTKAKEIPNSENENEYENDIVIDNDIEDETNTKTNNTEPEKIYQAEHPLILHIQNNFKEVGKMKDQLTFEQAQKLIDSYPKATIHEILEAMENYVGLQKKYKSVYLTINNWCKRRKDNPINTSKYDKQADISNHNAAQKERAARKVYGL